MIGEVASINIILQHSNLKPVRISRVHMNRVRVCNYVKFETGRNLLPVLKIVTCTTHAAYRHEPLLLSIWPSILFLVQFNNFDWTGLQSVRVTHSSSNRTLLALLMSNSTWDSVCCSEECVYCSAAFSEGLVGGPAYVSGKGGKGRDRGGGGRRRGEEWGR